MLYRLRCENQRWRLYAPMLLMENPWRAMRYSFDEGLIDLAKGVVVPLTDLVDELIELVHKDAQDLGCLADVERAREILVRGTSAHRQLRVYEAALAEGASETEALQAVVDRLIEETAQVA
jgi:carboxylate-amine ligase